MPAPITAIDAIAPAFTDAKRMLFAPWKFSIWMRMAVLGLFTGEFAGGGWMSSPTTFTLPQQPHMNLPQALVSTGDALPAWVRENLFWLAICGLLVIVLFFIVEYLASVSRFVLFDAVATGHTELRTGWSKWRRQGVRFFFWQAGFAVVCLVALFFLVGIPLIAVIRRMPPGEPNWGELLPEIFSLFLSVFIFLIVAGLIKLFAKDFLVPVMAVENCGVWQGWRRVISMLGAEKLAYTVYVLMKIVLSVGATVLFGIADFMAFLILLIPMGIAGIVIYLIVRNMDLSWSFGTISAIVVGAGLLIAVFMYVFAFIYSPGLVFFQSYTLRFFAARYPALDALMNPRPPAPPAPIFGR